MRRLGLLVPTLVCLAAPTLLRAQEVPEPPPGDHLIHTAADLEWRPGPGSLAPGAEFVVLEGDPAREGIFTMRIRMPDGFVISPHWHPNVERLTVLSGTFRIGMGERFDRQATRPLPAGSYFSFPPGMRHFAVAEGSTVVQLTSEGPWQLRYVDPADDPRTRR